MIVSIINNDIVENMIVIDDTDDASKFGGVPASKDDYIGKKISHTTLEDRVSTLETETADLNEALNMILTGVTE